jgi:hypothetical protein
MKILQSFKTGLGGVLKNKKMWLLFFSVQLVFALILVRPLQTGLDSMVGRSLMGQEIITGKGANVLIEFLAHKADVVSVEIALLLFMGIAFLIVSIFLKAGAVGCFVHQKKNKGKQFFQYSGEYFGRFLRLFFFSLVFFLAAVLLYLGLDSILKLITGDSEAAKVILKITGWIFLLFLLFLVRMVFDYAKVMTVTGEKKKMLKTSLQAWRFVIKHPAKTLGLFYLTGITGVLIWAIYYFPFGLIPAAGFGIYLIFIWQQIFAFSRTGVNLLFLSSQTALYQGMISPSIPVQSAE